MLYVEEFAQVERVHVYRLDVRCKQKISWDQHTKFIWVCGASKRELIPSSNQCKFVFAQPNPTETLTSRDRMQCSFSAAHHPLMPHSNEMSKWKWITIIYFFRIGKSFRFICFSFRASLLWLRWIVTKCGTAQSALRASKLLNTGFGFIGSARFDVSNVCGRSQT